MCQAVRGRHGRIGKKPEILATGTDITAANGFSTPTRSWTRMTGTSMASPYAAGVAGLMLATQRNLTASQIIGIMRRNAKPIDDNDFSWKDDNGFGLVDPAACIEEAHAIHKRKDLT